jgi:hypothetical protein
MYPNFKLDLSVALLENCSRKHEDFKHPESCMCNGSGLQPTSLGYEVIRFLTWLFEFAAWRVINVSYYKRSTTLQDVVNEYTKRVQSRDNRDPDYQEKL